MIKECKKCGYIRQTIDTSPNYECPKCGVVYKKYEEHLESARQMEMKKKEMKTKKTNRKFLPIIWIKEKFANAKILISNLPIFSKFFYVSLTALLASSILYFANYFLTPEDIRDLRDRYSTYVKAASSLDLDTSYQHLSSDSRAKIDQYGWKIHNKEANPAVTEKIEAIKLSSNGMTAIVTAAAIIDGTPVKLYMQTWVKEGDTWFRDWAQDYPEKVIEVQKEVAKLNNENSKPEIYRIETGFDITRKDFDKIFITPKTTLVIHNKGYYPITYLKIKVDYYDKDNSNILYSTERSVVSDGDAPIPRNGKSDVIYANSGAGFSLHMTTIDDGVAKHIKDRVDRAFFYKLSYQGQWVRLSTDDLRDLTEIK